MPDPRARPGPEESTRAGHRAHAVACADTRTGSPRARSVILNVPLHGRDTNATGVLSFAYAQALPVRSAALTTNRRARPNTLPLDRDVHRRCCVQFSEPTAAMAC
jgi:hypothetical protein